MSDYQMPVNIGNPSEITIKTFAEEILDLVKNPEARIIYKELPQDDPKQRQPDISLAKRLLGWEPSVTRQEGLKMTYDYFREKVQV